MPVMGEKRKGKEPEREPSNGEKGEKTQQRILAREKAPTRGREKSGLANESNKFLLGLTIFHTQI